MMKSQSKNRELPRERQLPIAAQQGFRCQSTSGACGTTTAMAMPSKIERRPITRKITDGDNFGKLPPSCINSPNRSCSRSPNAQENSIKLIARPQRSSGTYSPTKAAVSVTSTAKAKPKMKRSITRARNCPDGNIDIRIAVTPAQICAKQMRRRIAEVDNASIHGVMNTRMTPPTSLAINPTPYSSALRAKFSSLARKGAYGYMKLRLTFTTSLETIKQIKTNKPTSNSITSRLQWITTREHCN